MCNFHLCCPHDSGGNQALPARQQLYPHECSLKTTAQKLQDIRETLLQKYEREPTVSEIAAEMQLSPEEVVLAVNAGLEPVSIFEPVFNDSSDPVHLMELLKDMENADERWLENIELKEALDRLSLRESTL